MPAEQPSAHHPHPTPQGPAEQRQHPSSRGGVRMLLGLPCGDSGAPSTVALTAPPGRQRYAQSLLPATEERHESFGETAADEGVIEETREVSADLSAPLTRHLVYGTTTPGDFPPALQRHDTPFSRAMRGNASEASQALTPPVAEQREQTRLVIPGVSTHRTDFPALAQTTADTPRLSVGEETPHAMPPQAAPLNAPASLPRTHAMTTSDVALLTRLEQLVTAGARAQQGAEAWSRTSAPLAPDSLAQTVLRHGEHRGQDLAQRFEQLQRTVRELAATVSAQIEQQRHGSQEQWRARTLSPTPRVVVIKRSDEPSTTPRAFWERHRLGRFYLKTGR